MKTKYKGNGMTLKKMQRQKHREATKRLEDAILRKDKRAIIVESVNVHAGKP